jgi:hypothetical protein
MGAYAAATGTTANYTQILNAATPVRARSPPRKPPSSIVDPAALLGP